MSTERPVEKLLREQARKRRESAGPPFEMHPATRRVLQDEVRRVYGAAPARRRSFTNFLALLGPKFAWGVAAAAMVIGIAALIFPFHRPGRQEMASTEKPDVAPVMEFVPGEARSGVASLAQASPPAASIDRDAGKTIVAEDLDKSATGKLPGNAAPAMEKPLAQNQPFPVLAPAETGKDAVVPTNGNFGPAQNNLGFVLRDEAARRNLASGVENQLNLRFTQVPAGSSLVLTKDKKSVPAAVLTSFDVQQSGNGVRVVDHDGSIYTGTVMQPPAGDGRKVSATMKRAELSDAAAPALTQNQQAVPGLLFRVAGTNRTLNQPVVFTGNITGVEELPQNLTSNQSTQQQNRAYSQNAIGNKQQLVGPAQLNGTAVIGDKTQLQINAVPANR